MSSNPLHTKSNPMEARAQSPIAISAAAAAAAAARGGAAAHYGNFHFRLLLRLPRANFHLVVSQFRDIAPPSNNLPPAVCDFSRNNSSICVHVFQAFSGERAFGVTQSDWVNAFLARVCKHLQQPLG